MVSRLPRTVQRARRKRFEGIVHQAIRSLPHEATDLLANVAIVVEDEPPAELVGSPASETALFGFYEGTPHLERDQAYSLTLPDKITIYRLPHERACADPNALREEVRLTLIHELAHHMGLDEQRVEELGWA